MKEYRVELWQDDGNGPFWETVGSYDKEDYAIAYAKQWQRISPGTPTRVVRQELVAEYRGEQS